MVKQEIKKIKRRKTIRKKNRNKTTERGKNRNRVERKRRVETGSRRNGKRRA